MGDDPAQQPHLGEGPAGRPLPLSVRLLGAGVKGARTVTRAAGIDRAVEAAAEEAMVAAVESEAVERALARVLRGPVVEDAVQGALESEAVKRALVDALDSELVDEVWRRLLASDEAQRLVERIAEAPEIRAAISAQSVGLIGDLGRTIGNTARRLDDGIERIVRRIFFRRRRLDPTDRAGALTRALAFAVDGFIINLSFSGLAAVAALIASAFWGTNGGVSDLALALGTGAWLVLGGVYMAGFWCLAGQTPGMRFLGIRLGDPGYRLSFGQALRRLFGFSLCVATLGIGFLGIVFGERRRAWDDSLSGSEVLYDDRRAEPAPWSTLAGAEAGAEGASETTKAPSSRGLRAQQVADRPLSG